MLEIECESEYNFIRGRRLVWTTGWYRCSVFNLYFKGKKMNRSLLVAAFVAVGLTACGEKPVPAPAPAPPAKQAPKVTPAPADTPAPAPTPAPSSGMAPDAMKTEPAKDTGAGMTPPDMAKKGENMATDPAKGAMDKDMMKK